MNIDLRGDMNIIKVNREAGMIMIEWVGAEHVCKYCGVKITEKNFGGIFSRPTRVCCDNLVCLVQAIGNSESENKDDAVVGVNDYQFRWM